MSTVPWEVQFAPDNPVKVKKDWATGVSKGMVGNVVEASFYEPPSYIVEFPEVARTASIPGSLLALVEPDSRKKAKPLHQRPLSELQVPDNAEAS